METRLREALLHPKEAVLKQLAETLRRHAQAEERLAITETACLSFISQIQAKDEEIAQLKRTIIALQGRPV